ncbi:hypothetical protein GCM10010236_10760 [Streptomyces eurythermus]|nr:hypothetical protein GCM10010236_10760 [Streptomyces eurythermus]
MNQSTWDPVPVRRRIAERLVPQIGPEAWAVDDVSFPKDGRMSVGVTHQYCGALGKQANCLVAVSVHAVSDTASCPLNWRLFLPQEWADDAVRRRRTGVPEDVGHREKWRLALNTLDELAGWGPVPPVVVADAGYGQNAHFRAALTERGHAYVVGIRGDLTVQPYDALPDTPAWSGNGRQPVPRYRQPPVPVTELAAAAGREAFQEVTWREGSRGPTTSRFLAAKVRPAGVRSRRLAQQAAVTEHGRWDGITDLAGLLDLVTDHLAARLPDIPPGTKWATATRSRFTALYELLTAHPGLLALRGSRPWLSPQLLQRLVEPQLADSLAAGMTPEEAIAAYRRMYLLTLGSASFVDHRDPRTAQTATRQALAALDPEQFPVLTGHLAAILPATTDHDIYYSALNQLIRAADPAQQQQQHEAV